VRFGLYSRSLPGADKLGPQAILQRVAELGLAGCLFASALHISSTLDPLELHDAHALARDLGLSLSVAFGQIHPHHFDERRDILQIGDGDIKVGLERLLRAVRAIDCTELMFTIGTLEDRFNRTVAWSDQLDATAEFLQSLTPIVAELGCHLNLKTHEDITSFEILRVIEKVGEEVVGVCFDPVNVLARLEDPLAAARRLAPYIRQLHVDDAIIQLSDNGLERWLCPCGNGIVDWPAIFAMLYVNANLQSPIIELHRAHLQMPAFDTSWLAAQPDLTLPEFAAVLKLVWASDARAQELVGRFETDPFTRFQPTLAYLRSIGSLSPTCST